MMLGRPAASERGQERRCAPIGTRSRSGTSRKPTEASDAWIDAISAGDSYVSILVVELVAQIGSGHARSVAARPVVAIPPSPAGAPGGAHHTGPHPELSGTADCGGAVRLA